MRFMAKPSSDPVWISDSLATARAALAATETPDRDRTFIDDIAALKKAVAILLDVLESRRP
jgi:hypothetical protein